MRRKNIFITLLLMPLVAFIFVQCLGAEVNSTPLNSDSTGFSNPERGWYRSMETDSASLSELRDFKKDNITLVAFETYLGDYITKPLDTKKLNEIDMAFSLARLAGLSVIYRAAYDFDGKDNPEPANIQIILNHIKQLSPIFNKYEDILFNIQAGFLGPWGEWHHSHFGDPVKPEYQRMIANELLNAAPKSVFIAVRRPEYIRNIAGKAPLTASEAFNGSVLSRMAFHNDALMSEKTDMDTYIDPDYQPVEKEFEWINNHTRFTPFVGETNKLSGYNDPENAIRFLDLMNAISLNSEYHPAVLRKWRGARHGGMSAHEFIGMKLGYRFELKKAVINREAPSGGAFNLDFELVNTGFGNLLKAKKFEIVFIKEEEIIRMEINEDARFWNKNEEIRRNFNFSLPNDMSAGNWDVYLGLTSTFKSLADNPAYSVRFANEDIWNAKYGLNRIGEVKITDNG